MKTLPWLITLGLSCATIGCGEPEEFDSGIQGRGAADLKAALGCGPAPTLPAKGEAAAEVPALSRAPADYLLVRSGDATISLCDAMRAGGKPLTVLTFTDPACAECMTYTTALSDAFAGKTYASNVQTMAVMVPELGAEEFAAAGEAAPKAAWASDVSKGLWHFFNPDAANRDAVTTPVGVVLDGEGRGFVLQDGEDAKAIWAMILAAYREAAPVPAGD